MFFLVASVYCRNISNVVKNEKYLRSWKSVPIIKYVLNCSLCSIHLWQPYGEKRVLALHTCLSALVIFHWCINHNLKERRVILCRAGLLLRTCARVLHMQFSPCSHCIIHVSKSGSVMLMNIMCALEILPLTRAHRDLNSEYQASASW